MIKEFQKEYRWLSNFAPCKIKLDNLEYQSVEHAYMSAKNEDIAWKEFCQKTTKPGEVKQASKKITLVSNWNEIKIKIMSLCIDQKYNQEPYKTLLLNTNNEYIQEGNYWKDTFWGVDLKTNSGQNILGNLIMEKRKELQKIKTGE
jgi:ribA/ribD-fused uncharacterized protein